MKKLFLLLTMIAYSTLSQAGKDPRPSQPWGPRGPLLIYRHSGTVMSQVHTMNTDRIFKCNYCPHEQIYNPAEYPNNFLQCPNCRREADQSTLPTMILYQGTRQLPGQPSKK